MRLETQTISRLAKKVFADIGIVSSRVVCHSCRSTCATLLLENGVSIRKVQKLLRHRSSDTSERYANDLNRYNNNSVQFLSTLLFSKE